MPLQATSGAASYDGFGGGVAAVPNYIEDVFSTYLWTTSTSNQTINNGIDMTKGALTWIKSRSNAFDHVLQRAAGYGGSATPQFSNSTSAGNPGYYRLSDTTSGFTMGTDYYTGTPQTAVVWTFRKQPKFFDVVTWTGNNADGRFISHSLGSAPGMVIIKNTSSTYDWVVWHRSLANPSKYLVLNSTAATATDIYGPFGSYDGGFTTNSACFTSTGFYVAADARSNLSGNNYVAYIFAHDAGGFGLTGTDNVISCGSFTTDGSGTATVSLGYEPQWILWKRSDDASNWLLLDNMRSWNVSGNDFLLRPNLSDAESTGANYGFPTATGFYMENMAASATYIYIAIRRGPMKTPTTGTSVFGNNARSGTGANATVTGGQTDDLVIFKNRGSAQNPIWATRLTDTRYMQSNGTAAEVAAGTNILQSNPWDVMDGVKVGTTSALTNASSNTFINYLFRRAPGFFDVVCYTGTGSATTVTHNLGAVPELMIVKSRSLGVNSDWAVYNATSGNTGYTYLNDSLQVFTSSVFWNNTTPTASVFTVGTNSRVNSSGETYVAYLFASCPGVSKVGTYTGTGALQTIDCGFTGGARWVMIKRTDDVGDWLVYDSARGITSGNDPYFRMNSSAAEITGTNYVDTTSVGFQVTAAAPAGLNASGGTYIFLAIA
jgi:hypothetical protein